MNNKGFGKDKKTKLSSRKLSKQSIESYRESLLDRHNTLEVAKFYIQKALEEQKSRIQDGETPPVEPEFWLQYFKQTLEHDTLNSINFIFDYSESPIETIFLNSLLLSFIAIQPLSLIITPPPAQNTLSSIKQFRANHENITKLWDYFQEEYSSDPLGRFINYTHDKFGEETKNYLLNHVIRYLIIPFSYDFYHLTMQANFPDFKVNGRSIRADIFVWVPGNENFKLIVECDGFQYHSKDAFTSDRRRDRLFQREGYEVLRYSGSEIHRNPFEVSWDLFTYLENRINLNFDS